MKRIFSLKREHSLRETFREAWNISWNSIYLLADKMFIAILAMLLLSGVMTWYGIEYLNLQERNMLIEPLLRFGTSYIFLYDVIAMTLTYIIYKTTRKSRIIHCALITFLFIGASFDVLNNIGQIYGIPLLSAIGDNSPNPYLIFKRGV